MKRVLFGIIFWFIFILTGCTSYLESDMNVRDNINEIEYKYEDVKDEQSTREILDWLSQNHDLNKILASKEVLEFSDVLNAARGGVRKNIDIKNIPSENIEMLKSILPPLGLNLGGVDISFEKDIETSVCDQEYSIIEVNASPYIDQHYIFDKEVGSKIIKAMFDL